MISIIAAVANNGVIGNDNKLLWHLPDDLKRFKRLTEGHVVIMGQKTYESLPKRPLPNRTNIVITDDINFTADKDVIIASSIDEAIGLAEMVDKFYNNKVDEIFVIGGASIYRQFLPLADKLYITHINQNFHGDVSFPRIDEEWKLIEEEPSGCEEFEFSYQIWTK